MHLWVWMLAENVIVIPALILRRLVIRRLRARRDYLASQLVAAKMNKRCNHVVGRSLAPENDLTLDTPRPIRLDDRK